MSDEFTSGWESGDIQGGVNTGSHTDRPGPVHEQLWNMIRDMVREEIQAVSPRMATVMENASGGVKLQMDDEDESRTINMARKTGNRYKAGDRVVVHKTRGGEEFVGGVISGQSDGQSGGRVGEPDFEENAVSRRTVAFGAIGKDELSAGIVDIGHLTGGANGLASVVAGALQESDVKGSKAVGANNRLLTEESGITSDDVQGNPRGGDKIITQSAIKNWALKSDLPNMSDYLKDGDIAGGAKKSASGGNAFITLAEAEKKFAPKKANNS